VLNKYYKKLQKKCAILFVVNTTKGGIIMLKFQNNDTTAIATFEDFILITHIIYICIMSMHLLRLPNDGITMILMHNAKPAITCEELSGYHLPKCLL